LYLECSAEEGEDVEGPLEWFAPDDKPIWDEEKGNTRVYVEPSSPLTLPLFITKIQKSDEGTYVCTASGADGKLRQVSVKLQLYIPVHFKETSRFQQIVKGKRGKITCRAKGTPEPDLVFEKHGVPLIWDKGKRYHGRMGRGVAMESLKFHLGPPCPTLLCPAGGTPLKQPYGRFRGGPLAGRAACGRLLPF
jgi:hypothetical protein